jgi:putative transposase
MGTFLVDSEGTKYVSPQYLRNSFKNMQVLSRKLSKKKKGSNNRKKAKMQLISLHEKIVNQRNDWQWKMILQLIRSYDTIILESLSFLEIQKGNDLKTKAEKRGRARKTLDLSPGSFFEKLKYKAAEYGKTVVFIDKWFPSSQICNECMCAVGKMPTHIRIWTCPDCGTVHDRDHNAAKNILREGTSSLGIGDVSLGAVKSEELLPF